MPILYDQRKGLKQPVLQDQLWRYMNFAKFVDMLRTRKLHLTSVDKLAELGDKFEGVFPAAPKGGFLGFFGEEQTQRYRAEKSKNLRRFYYANCWHGNDSESDAMWKVYVKGNQGIAIHTTVRSLKASLEGAAEIMWLAKVKYLPKPTWKNTPDDQALHACVTKRKSFVHENEVRIIWHDTDAKKSGRRGQDGKEVSCDLAKLIEKVYLAPTGSPWFKRVVEDILRKYNLNVEVVPSDLDSKP